MKKTIYISGIIIANLLLIGSIFKINHWPGANIALTLSLLALSFWFIPAALLNNYKAQKEKNKKWLYISTFISFFIVFVAALFKILHWPGAGLLILIGVPIPFLLFLPVYIYHSIRDKEQSPVNFTGVILGLTFVAVYSVLLAVNVSRNVLDHGLSLIKSNENVIDFYELRNDLYANMNAEENIQYETISKMSDEICSLIHKAEKEILNYTGNTEIDANMGNASFNRTNLVNYDNRNASQFVLKWKEEALVPLIKEKLIAYTKYLNTLELNPELKSTIDEIDNTDVIYVDGEKFTWEDREFASDYMIFALEALSRWEKNIRFIESMMLAELIDTSSRN